MESSSPKIKKVLIFSLKKLFLYFRKWNLKKCLIFQKRNFRAHKIKKTALKKVLFSDLVIFSIFSSDIPSDFH